MTAPAVSVKPVKTPDSLLLKATLLVTGTLTVMAGATVAPALPAMQAFFADVPNVEFLVRLVLTMPALTIVMGAPIAGAIVDRYGRKRLLVFSALLYGVAGSSGYLLDSLVAVLLGRALLGLAVAGIMTTVTTLIADYFIGPARAQFLGWQASFSGLGGVVFLTLGGFLADMDWHSPFLIYLMAFLMLPFILFVLYEPPRNQAMKRHPEAESDDAPLVLPTRLLGLIYTTMAFTQVVFYLLPVQLPFYLETLLGASAFQSGLAVAALSLCFATGSFTFGWINRYLGHLSLIAVGFTITGIGYLIVMVGQSWVLILLGLALSGFGLGWIVPNLNVWVANSVPEALRGRALGGVTTALFLGQFLSPIVLQPVLTRFGDNGTFAVVGGAALSVALLFFLGRKAIANFVKSV